MKQYLELCNRALRCESKPNRTGVNTVGYFGDMKQYDLSKGFPAITTKKLAYKAVFAEMLGFLRGYDNSNDFKKLGCNVWNANANENESWLENPSRKGVGDLGRIYGVQARKWGKNNLDQLRIVYDNLITGDDKRRSIVTHWNPSELDKMALPPCHMFYQFNISGDYLNMSMYQRSCDLPLGVPFNIAGYAWLLSVMAHITGYEPGIFTHMMGDVHIYENQIETMREVQLHRRPLVLPTLEINDEIRTLTDLETWVTVDDFNLYNYNHHDKLYYSFSV